MSYKEQIDVERIPRHVAIIMDGNGRWAKQRGRERSYGHRKGAETVHLIAEEAARLGIGYLTLYTFSTENWNRPSEEVAALMGLLFDSIEEETFMKNNIRFRIIGDVEKLPDNVRQRLDDCIAHTAGNTGCCGSVRIPNCTFAILTGLTSTRKTCARPSARTRSGSAGLARPANNWADNNDV